MSEASVWLTPQEAKRFQNERYKSEEYVHEDCLEFQMDEIKNQAKRISSLESALRGARECITFYANKNNWDDRWVDMDGDGRDGDVYDVINSVDVDIEEDEDGPYQTHGGRKARAFLSRIDEVLKEGRDE